MMTLQEDDIVEKGDIVYMDNFYRFCALGFAGRRVGDNNEPNTIVYRVDKKEMQSFYDTHPEINDGSFRQCWPTIKHSKNYLAFEEYKTWIT
jgi:hypothetical protein